MKKFISALLAVLFVMTSFGVTAIFGGIIEAGALYDYYIYTKMPGLANFTNDELALFTNPFTSAAVHDDSLGIENCVTWTVRGLNEWSSLDIHNYLARNMEATANTEHRELRNNDIRWCAKDCINGKTIVGDKSFAEQDGVAFRIYVNGAPYNGGLTISMGQLPAKGPYFDGKVDKEGTTGYLTAEELYATGTGFWHSSKEVWPDEDGYVHLDFKTDFYQADWWSKDDNGVNQKGTIYEDGEKNFLPVPEWKIAAISDISYTIHTIAIGDTVSIGELMAYRDSRVHLDELDETMMLFDSLDPEAYTESSYEAATEVYLRAYEIMNDENIGEKYTQKQINTIVNELKDAINALQPLFKVKSDDYKISGFEGLTDNDLDRINDGGASIDVAMLDDTNVPEGSATKSIYIIGGAQDGEPYYGWSHFVTGEDDGEGGITPIGNVFEGDPLSETAGLRFWIKFGDDYIPRPYDIIVGVGSSENGVQFECESAVVDVPEDEGYIGVAWSSFYDLNGEYDIYDLIDELDYFYIGIDGCNQYDFYISDLHPFVWSINSASFADLDKAIIDAVNYMAGLNEEDWSFRSWERLEVSIDTARAMHETYGVTQQDIEKAISDISGCINRLTKRGDTATREEVAALNAAFIATSTYWHGNYTGRSYADMKAVADKIALYIEDEMSSASCIGYTNELNEAIAKLVPITHSGIVNTILSPEDMTSRVFQRTEGHRRPNVDYALVSSSTSVTIPVKNAVKMTATTDLSSKVIDEHGALQYKLADKFCNPLEPDIEVDGNTIGATIGKLSGTDGIRLWIGVNDVNLAKNAYFRFGVSNCSEGPLFERHAANIPFPASGSGWIYIPWDYFEYYDEWTKGEMINLDEIRFWIARVDGEVPKGLEVYFTGIDAYTGMTQTTNKAPTITGVADGATVDVSAVTLIPKWDLGSATLNGSYYTAGTPITVNGDYVFTVTNGDKKASVSFTVTGGATAFTVPIVVGVEDGAAYDSEVSITWDVGEATLNGEPIVKGAAVSAPGSYTLEVVNGDKSVVIRFTINSAEPEVKKGDFDNDGEITVTDALTALRIAAKLAPETDLDIAIGDTDDDGHVTVTDALAILRVAAKLATEL